ncbi:Transmembrane protein, partial [Ophiophagus hannah]
MTNPQPPIEGGVSEVEIISQQIEEETRSVAPVQLVNFAYRDLPLAALDLSVAGSQLLSNLDEEYQREGIVVLGIWDYIENKIEVFDGAVIILSLAPMVASTVANGPSSPWDAISLIITLRIWRVKRIIDAYVLPVKVEMEMVIQQYEKAKVIQDEQLERLTHICQEQGFEIRQLRAHLAQQDLDLAAEREAALQVPHMLKKQTGNRYKVVATGGDSDDETTENITELRPARETVVKDDMNNYISQYYNEPSSDSGVPEGAFCVITTAAIDVHQPNVSSDLFMLEMPMKMMESNGISTSAASGSASRTTREESSEYCPLKRPCQAAQGAQVSSSSPHRRVHNAVVQELLSSLSEDSCLTQKGLDPVNLKLPSPAGSATASPELERRVNIYNKKNQENFGVFQKKPVLPFQQKTQVIDKYTSLESKPPRFHSIPDS